MGVGIGGIKVFGEVFCLVDFSDVVIEGHGTTSAGIGRVGGGGGGFGQVSHQNTVQVGAGGFEGEAAEHGMVQAGQFQPRKVGRAIEGRFENREEGPDHDRPKESEASGGDRLGQQNIPCQREVQARGEDCGQKGHETKAGAGPKEVGAAGDFAGEEDGGQAGEERGEEVTAIGSEEKEFAHSEKSNEEKTCPRTDQSGEDEGGEGGGDEVGASAKGDAGCNREE